MPLDSLTIFSFGHVTTADPFRKAEFRCKPTNSRPVFLSVRLQIVNNFTDNSAPEASDFGQSF